MALERLGAQHGMAVVDKYVQPILATYQMTTRDYVVRPDPVLGATAILVSLPPVALAKGRYYSIMAKDATNALNVTVQDFQSDGGVGDSESWQANVVFNEAGRGAVFYSDGQHWYFGSQAFTSSLIAGAVNISEISLTMDTAGAATVDTLIVRLISGVMLGNSAGAIFAQVDYSSAAVSGVAGLSYAIGAEMKLPNNAAIPSGHYTCIDYEMATGALTDWGGGTKVSYMRFDDWGANEVEFAASAFFFTLAGVRLTGNMISLNCHTIKMQFETDANKTRYLVCSEAEDVLVMGNALTYEMITATYQVGIYGQIANDNANLANGWFVQDWFQLTIEADTDFTATSQMFGVYAYMTYAGAATWGGSGSVAAMVAQMVSGASVVSMADGIHAALSANLSLGAGFIAAHPAEVCNILVSSSCNAGAAMGTKYSGIFFMKIGAMLQMDYCMKVNPLTSPYLFDLYDDGAMVIAGTANDIHGGAGIRIKIRVNGAAHWLLASTVPA